MTDNTRYARQIQLPEFGEQGQAALAASHVLVIGLGGLGCPAAQYLVGAGVGQVTLIDRDVVEATNLHRQGLYAEADIGRRKVDAAAERLRAVNADIEIASQHTRLTEAVLKQSVAATDLVLDCTDNFPSRFAINRACLAARTALVSGAAVGLGGQVGVFRNDIAGTACYRCLFDEAGDAAERCEDAGVLGPVVGVIGTLQALEAIRLLAMPGTDTQSHWLHWDAKTRGSRHHALQRDPHCPEHTSQSA